MMVREKRLQFPEVVLDMTEAQLIKKFLANRGESVSFRNNDSLVSVRDGGLYSCSALIAKYDSNKRLGIRGDLDNLIPSAKRSLGLLTKIMNEKNIAEEWSFKVVIGDVVPIYPKLRRIK